MKSISRSVRLLLACLLATGLACGGDDGASIRPDAPDAGNALASDASSSSVDDAAADDDDISDEDNDVPCTPDYPDYSDGMTAKAGDLTVRLLGISPAPPRQIISNNWQLELHNADGSLATDATVTSADSYMPVHRHHGLTPPVVKAGASPGQVAVTAINFRMRGPWQVIVNVLPAGGKAALATFPICVQ